MQLRRAGAYVCGEITVGPATASASQVGWASPTRHRWRSKWPVGDGHATSFAMAVAKGEWSVRRRKRFRRRGLRTRKGAMVLRAIGGGKRQNRGGFATRGRAADGKTAGCGGGVLQKQGGFATKVRENTGSASQNRRPRKSQTGARTRVSPCCTRWFRKSVGMVLRKGREAVVGQTGATNGRGFMGCLWEWDDGRG